MKSNEFRKSKKEILYSQIAHIYHASVVLTCIREMFMEWGMYGGKDVESSL